MIRNVVCAVDGSVMSIRAIDVAVQLAVQLGAALTFLHVERANRAGMARSPFWDSRLVEAADAQTHRVLGTALESAKRQALSAVTCATVQAEDIGEAIVGFAEDRGAQLIVLGSVGLTGIARVLVGSVAQDVVAKAHCPVVVAR